MTVSEISPASRASSAIRSCAASWSCRSSRRARPSRRGSSAATSSSASVTSTVDQARRLRATVRGVGARRHAAPAGQARGQEHLVRVPEALDRRSILTGGCQEAATSLSGMSTPKLVLCELADPGLPGIESYSPFCLKAHRALQGGGSAVRAPSRLRGRRRSSTTTRPARCRCCSSTASRSPTRPRSCAASWRCGRGAFAAEPRRGCGRSWPTRASTASWSRRAGPTSATGR